MSDIFFTSDSHFGHERSFITEPRGFSSVEEMNEAIIERWNNVVKPDDIVYHLGDVFLNNNEVGLNCVKRLNGNIFLIFGNHETDVKKELLLNCPNISGGVYAHFIKYNKIGIYLSHYPSLTANYDDKHFSQHVINFHGHTHQQANFMYPNNPFMYHVGVDSHNCAPVNIEEAVAEIKQRYIDLQNLRVPCIHEPSYIPQEN